MGTARSLGLTEPPAQLRGAAPLTDELPSRSCGRPATTSCSPPSRSRAGRSERQQRPYRDIALRSRWRNVARTFWSPKWSRTRDHGPVLNGTARHVRPIFAIQINTSRDRTKWAETATNKFRVRCLQALSAPSVAAKRSIWFGRLRASPCAAPNVGMIVGPDRQNANNATISNGFGGTPSPPAL